MSARFWGGAPAVSRAPAPPPGPARFAALIALVGAAAAGMLVPTVQRWEGRELAAYRDVASIWTICDGDTANVRPGMVETPAGCDRRLERQLIAHAKPVLACTPGIRARPHVLAAATSLAYNIGPTAYCRSTAARRFNAGDMRGGCDAMLAWDKARVNGRLTRVRGLANRRAHERAICLKDAA